MGEATNQIEAHIEDTRADLGSNLYELERKVKSVTDWRQYYQRDPKMLLGAAFGGGILLATMVGGRGRRRERVLYRANSSPEPHVGSDHQKSKALETWDNIKGALIGVAATRFKDFVGEVVPGFQEQFHKTEEKVKAIGSPDRL